MIRWIVSSALLLLAVGCARGKEASCHRYREDTVELMKELVDAERAVKRHATPDARGAAMLRKLAEETDRSLEELKGIAPRFEPLARAHQALVTATRALPRAYRVWADAAENEDALGISRAEQRAQAILGQRLAASQQIDKVCK